MSERESRFVARWGQKAEDALGKIRQAVKARGFPTQAVYYISGEGPQWWFGVMPPSPWVPNQEPLDIILSFTPFEEREFVELGVITEGGETIETWTEAVDLDDDDTITQVLASIPRHAKRIVDAVEGYFGTPETWIPKATRTFWSVKFDSPDQRETPHATRHLTEESAKADTARWLRVVAGRLREEALSEPSIIDPNWALKAVNAADQVLREIGAAHVWEAYQTWRDFEDSQPETFENWIGTVRVTPDPGEIGL